MRKFVVRIVLPLVASLSMATASARIAELRAAHVVQEAVTADGLVLRLAWPDGASEGTLALTAERLALPDNGIVFRDLHWDCIATRTTEHGIACDGELRARNVPKSRLRAAWRDDMLDLAFTQAKVGVALAGPDADAAWKFKATRVPATWLRPLLATLWPDGRITDGSIDADWRIASTDDGALTLAGPTRLASLGLDTSDGTIAAASLDADGNLDLKLGDRASRIHGELTLGGGELLFGTFYTSLPETPIALQWTLANGGDAIWSLQDASWLDKGAFELRGDATIDSAAQAPLRQADIAFSSADLATATPRYLDSLLGGAGLAGLKTGGALQGNLRLREGGLDRLELRATNVAANDAAGRFGVDGLDGTLAFNAGDTPLDSSLRWREANVHDIRLGPTTLALRSQSRGLALTQPAAIPALGGELTLPRFAWRTASGNSGEGDGLDLAVRLRDVDLRQLSSALGWPEFAGTLSGDIPSVQYADEVLDLQGGLAMQVFDGNVTIDQLTLERPFGVAPTMTGAIAFSDLDLKPLTGAFGFGEITGRLEGFVRGLRLVDWEPVAFDASFRTSTKAKDPRRISQRAVRDLTEVGGGGIAAGLQAQVLKVFQTFGYARIGLSCTLANDVCRMGGLDAGAGGYTIVEGSGLPRVTVIGHQRQVDWPVLVARLKATTEGQAPIVD